MTLFSIAAGWFSLRVERITACSFLLSLPFLLISCSNTKFLADGQSLYVKGNIRLNERSKAITSHDALASMQSVMVPSPNKKLLGARMKLAVYNRVKEPRKQKGFRYFLKYKLGEPPVLLSDFDPKRTGLLMKNRLNNYGHFRSSVRDSVEIRKGKATVTYIVEVATPYVIDSVFFPGATDRLTRKIELTKDSSLLKPGGLYNLQTISDERIRIDKMLGIEGYYYFSEDYIIIRVDTTIGNHRCNMYVDLKRNIPPEGLRYYKVGMVDVFPEYTLIPNVSLKRGRDTLLIDSMRYITSQHMFKPQAIMDHIFFKQGQIYDTRNYTITMGRLLGLGVFKFASIKFDPDSVSEDVLNGTIYLTPTPKRSLRGEVLGIVKDNGFAGPGLNISARNRNVFRGAELFVLNFSGNYEVQYSRDLPPLQAFEFGITPQLIFPKFLLPFRLQRSNSPFVPKTKIEAGYKIENREGYYLLNSFNLSFGYNWKETITKEHEFTPVLINFVNTTQTTAAYDSILAENEALEESYERQFVLGIGYAYTFSNQVTGKHRSPVYFKGALEFSGNAVYLLQSLFQPEKGTPENPFEIFSNPYSQYGWCTLDFRYYLATGRSSKLAMRVFTGVGLPYGNGDVMPYYKGFSSGGINDLRGFRSRSVGPGVYHDPDLDSVGFYNQIGDLKLGLYAEYRFPIMGYLKGALFAEAGNIWMQSTKIYGEDGVFRFNQFYRQLAVDAGLGLRLDITYVVVRFDLATPLRIPYLAENYGWVFKPFQSDAYGRSNVILNFSISYPF